jgi:hypothetical protein
LPDFFKIITLLPVGLFAPKLYHNFGARVKNFFVGVFPYVVFMQPGTILALRTLARFLLIANSMPAPLWCTCTVLGRTTLGHAPLWCVSAARCASGKMGQTQIFGAALRQNYTVLNPSVSSNYF